MLHVNTPGVSIKVTLTGGRRTASDYTTQSPRRGLDGFVFVLFSLLEALLLGSSLVCMCVGAFWEHHGDREETQRACGGGAGLGSAAGGERGRGSGIRGCVSPRY
ncbi:hypothetical protein EYF80_067421 [Liparis tanakae]|uniref:Uncharacterized protein n=1 Tax=Liparis tanakae TaxID=230148 RepID=A0A4Z2E111_9TELE|nr:hypothetical protein EYF80_067421 [Liparis tanakae]